MSSADRWDRKMELAEGAERANRTCIACEWRGDVGHEAHIRFIHPDRDDLVVVEQMDKKFIVSIK